jgi:hypothetical protein
MNNTGLTTEVFKDNLGIRNFSIQTNLMIAIACLFDRYPAELGNEESILQ